MKQTWFFFPEERNGEETSWYRYIRYGAVFFTESKHPGRIFARESTVREFHDKIYRSHDNEGKMPSPSHIGLTVGGRDTVWIEGHPRFSDFERTFRETVSDMARKPLVVEIFFFLAHQDSCFPGFKEQEMPGDQTSSICCSSRYPFSGVDSTHV